MYEQADITLFYRHFLKLNDVRNDGINNNTVIDNVYVYSRLYGMEYKSNEHKITATLQLGVYVYAVYVSACNPWNYWR